MPNSSTTSLAVWTLVVQRVSQTSVQVWAGTLFADLKKPALAQVKLLSDNNSLIETQSVSLDQWKRPFRDHARRFYQVFTFVNLLPDTRYHLEFLRNSADDDQPVCWQTLNDAVFTTLPDSLPTDANDPFTIGLGSCFYDHRDGGQAAASYKTLYDRAPKKHQPDITFLTGDQVYLDIGFDSLSLISKEIRERIANDYAKHWQALGSMFTRGATWMIPDDHEYWNDYPNYKTNIPTLQALRLKKVRNTWTRAAKDGVLNVQQALPLETFQIGNDISFCLADLRSYRSETRFTLHTHMRNLLSWIKNLSCPGVLVLPQPLIVDENSSEKNLRSYQQQYKALICAIHQANHDIVVLSGDVHFGRISSVKKGSNGKKLIEIVSSPMSNLTGLNGIATACPQATPTHFPPSALNMIDCPAQKVEYDDSYMVSTKRGWLFSSYPMARTLEHFMTVGFSKLETGEVLLNADAWRVREREGENNLPKADFDKPFSIKLT